MARRGARRDRGKERFWRRLLRLWRRSGRTVRAFCTEHEVSEPSFFAWRRVLAERDQQRGQRAKPNSRASGDGALCEGGPTPSLCRCVSSRPRRSKWCCRVAVSCACRQALMQTSLRQLLAILEEERPC